MKILLQFSVMIMVLFLLACTDQPFENTELEKENESIIEVIPDTEIKHQVGDELPILERIEIQMKKDINSLDNIFQGELDNRELGFATFKPNKEYEYVNDRFNHTLNKSIQKELLEYIKNIEVELIEQDVFKYEDEFDFWIVRLRYGNYQSASIAVDLENKTLMISGGEFIRPNLYKVRENEEEVFKVLEGYFRQRD